MNSVFIVISQELNVFEADVIVAQSLVTAKSVKVNYRMGQDKHLKKTFKR